jgi:hypothetical protein
VVQVPGSDDVVGVAWNVDPYLFRFSPGQAVGSGVMRSLGPATPGIDGLRPRGVNTNHAGGLVFSAGGEVFFSVSRGDDHADILAHAPAVLNLMNIETGAVREVCELVDEGGAVIPYVSRAIRIGAEHLVLGTVSRTTAGIAHVVLDGDLAGGPWQATPRRYWG